MVRGDDVKLADGAKEEAGGEDDAEISECEADYDCQRRIGQSFGGCSVGFWRHSLLLPVQNMAQRPCMELISLLRVHTQI